MVDCNELGAACAVASAQALVDVATAAVSVAEAELACMAYIECLMGEEEAMAAKVQSPEIESLKLEAKRLRKMTNQIQRFIRKQD